MFDNSHRLLVGSRVALTAKPNAVHALARQPVVISRMKAEHGAALCAHQICGSDSYRPAIARGLTDNLIGSVDVLGASDALDCRHIVGRFE